MRANVLAFTMMSVSFGYNISMMLQRPDLHGWVGLKRSNDKPFLALEAKSSIEMQASFKSREGKRHTMKGFGSQPGLAYHGPFLLALVADLDDVTAILRGRH